MVTKLTLTMEGQVINSAKKYARQNNKSLSDIVENYLKSITATDETATTLSPKVRRLMGVIELPEDYDYKAKLSHSINKKHRQ